MRISVPLIIETPYKWFFRKLLRDVLYIPIVYLCMIEHASFFSVILRFVRVVSVTILRIDSIVKIHIFPTNKTIELHQAEQHHSLRISSVAFYTESPDKIQPHTE